MLFNIPKEITDQLSSIEKIINNIVNQFKIKFSKINHDLDKINDSITTTNSNLSDVYDYVDDRIAEIEDIISKTLEGEY